MKEQIIIIYQNGTKQICSTKIIAQIATNSLVKAKQEFQAVPSDIGRNRAFLFAGVCDLVLQSLDSKEGKKEAKLYGKMLNDMCEKYINTLYTLAQKNNELIYISDEIANSFTQIDLQDLLNVIIFFSANDTFAENWIFSPYLDVANRAKQYMSNVFKQAPNKEDALFIYSGIMEANERLNLEIVEPLSQTV
jgi:hypothetical protein